jgi:repressor LexA
VLKWCFLDSELDTRLRQAQAGAGRLVIGLTLQDIDDLAGHLAAEANHSNDAGLCRVFDGLLARLTALEGQHSDSPQSVPAATTTRPSFTAKQGQYLAFIHYYTRIHGQAPAEADFARYFRATPPAVHAMILALERAGCVERTPGRARSLRLRIPRADLPDLA